VAVSVQCTDVAISRYTTHEWVASLANKKQCGDAVVTITSRLRFVAKSAVRAVTTAANDSFTLVIISF